MAADNGCPGALQILLRSYDSIANDIDSRALNVLIGKRRFNVIEVRRAISLQGKYARNVYSCVFSGRLGYFLLRSLKYNGKILRNSKCSRQGGDAFGHLKSIHNTNIDPQSMRKRLKLENVEHRALEAVDNVQKHELHNHTAHGRMFLVSLPLKKI